MLDFPIQTIQVTIQQMISRLVFTFWILIFIFLIAQDNDLFLREFLKRYPQFQNNDFYVTGESYAGYYVPTLAKQILDRNRNGYTPKINIKGFMIGNGISDEVWRIEKFNSLGSGSRCYRSICLATLNH